MENNKLCISCFLPNEGKVCRHCGYVEPEKRRESLLPALDVLAERYIIGEVLSIDKSTVEYKAWDKQKNAVVEIQEYYPREVVSRSAGSTQLNIASSENRENYFKNIATIKENATRMFAFSDSPNIVNIFDCFEANNTVYIVKEYIEGMYLSDYIAMNGGRLDVETAVSVMAPVLDGLTQIHKYGLVHRSLTPKSIIITAENEVKITDFRFLKEASPYKFEDMTVHFSPGYAPPEQYRSKSKQGAFSDIYSAGAILYRMIAGAKPLDALNRSNEDGIRTLRELDGNVPEHVDVSVMKALNLTPDLRFKSAADFKNSLTAKKEVVDIDGRIVDMKKKKFNQNTVIMLAALVAAVALILYFILR